LKIILEQLEADIQRANSRRTEMETRQVQVSSDIEREARLIGESQELLENYAREKSALLAENEAQAQAAKNAQARADAAGRALSLAEENSASATQALAQLRASRSQAGRGAKEAGARALRLASQIKEVASEAENIRGQLEKDQKIAGLRKELEAAQLAAGEAEQTVVAAEKTTLEAQTALDGARPELAQLESSLSRLESEAETLARVVSTAENGLWPAVVDTLKVTPGYETALGAALGDDLDASLDAGAPVFWSQPGDDRDDPDLPEGAEALSLFVAGAGVLERGLGQVGVVGAKDGQRLIKQLSPGQRLVSRHGDLWRWDGLVSRADAPNAAAQRLSQRSRLTDLDAEIAGMAKQVIGVRQRVETLKNERQEAQINQQRRQQQWRDAQHLITRTHSTLDTAQRQVGELVTRQSALEEARVRLQSSLSEARAVEADALLALKECEAETKVAAQAENAQTALQEARRQSEAARLTLGGFENANRMRSSRIAQLDSEMANCKRRAQSAQAQAQTLQTRAGEIAGQLLLLAQSPDEFAGRRNLLDEQLQQAKEAHNRAADRLAQAQNHYREAERSSRSALHELADLRSEAARVDERLKGLIAQRSQIEQIIVENLGITAAKTAEAAGIKPEAALPDEQAMERKLERLKGERERLGGVNLSAEKEKNEVEEKLRIMLDDREDLIAADFQTAHRYFQPEQTGPGPPQRSV